MNGGLGGAGRRTMHDHRDSRRTAARRAVMLLWLVLSCAAATGAASEQSAASSLIGTRPNFLLILTDDHGYGDVSTYHASDAQTPQIDQLAADGLLFTRMRANCTVCSPSRAALLTGRYPDRVGVPGVIRTHPENSWGYFSPSVTTLADALRQAGYDTAIVGKWHLGLAAPNTPNARGFRLFRGFLGDMMDSYSSHLRHGQNYMRHNADVIEPQGHATDLFSDWAIEYLRERAAQPQQPFFLYLAYNAPHFPIEPPEEWLARVRQRAPQLDERRARNVAFVEHLDDRIGRVLQVLREVGLEQQTVVVLSADNGGSLPHAQNNDPWRDGKQSHYDGGLRVPFMLRWPSRIPAGARTDYAGLNFDVFPTFLELAGGRPAADLDAVSLVPLLQRVAAGGGSDGAAASSADADGQSTRELYFVRREGGPEYGGRSYEALIRGDWKLLQNDPYSPLELYNLRDDPYEQQDLAKVQRKIFNELSASLRRHIQRGGAVPWQPPTP